jgi:hypothetical protein
MLRIGFSFPDRVLQSRNPWPLVAQKFHPANPCSQAVERLW